MKRVVDAVFEEETPGNVIKDNDSGKVDVDVAGTNNRDDVVSADAGVELIADVGRDGGTE